jgi:MFS family permease
VTVVHLLGGRAADTFGRLRMFLTGLVVFTAASLASGLAANGGMLSASRSAQGVGAALLSFGPGAVVVTATTATTAAMTGLEHRDMGLASGLVSTSHELGAALGVAVIVTIAGASLNPGTGSAPVGGFGDAFTASALIAAAAAVLGAVLLPSGRPGS